MAAPTASDLIFSELANHNFSRTLGDLKRSALSIQNRLTSIQHDASFAQLVAEAYGRPLIANERCGSWYIDPKSKDGSAYFKSTDGHSGVWKFSLRRLNLHLLKTIGNNDGCIIIDSTRRGKRMPDALSKTIPIWCAVVNSFLFPDEAHILYTPPQVVSQSEHTQISILLPSFLLALQKLNLPLGDLRTYITKPLRPVWVTPESDIVPTSTIFENFHPVVCCTVSRRVVGGEMSEAGYIQGAADDTENWAHGLTPSIFWANQEALLSVPEIELPELIKSLASVRDSRSEGLRCLNPCSQIFIAPISALSDNHDDAIITLLPIATKEGTWRSSQTRMDVGLGPHKLGSRNLRGALSCIMEFVEANLAKRIVVACESGTCLSIGVGLAIICLFCDDNGIMQERRVEKVDKNYIRRRLGWISTCIPDANPSRATLQSVNSFLM